MKRYFQNSLFTLAMAVAAGLAADAGLGPGGLSPDWRTVDPENIIIFELTTGTVTIELAPEAAPRHAAQFRSAVREELYNGEYFYRVIDGHVAQAGLEFDMRIEDWPVLPLEAERSADPDGFVPLGNADLFAAPAGHRDGFAAGREGDSEWLLNCPGALGMARGLDADSGSVEFFIPIAPRRYLDRNYTIFGRVIDGMDNVHRLKRVDPVGEEEYPDFLDPDLQDAAFDRRADRLAPNQILAAWVASDLPEDIRPVWEVMRTGGAEWQALKDSKRDYSGADAFVYTPPVIVDICTLPVPARKVANETR